MTELEWKVFLFIKDFTGRGADCFYWLEGNKLQETNPAEVMAFEGAVVCHDFWLIRDVFYDQVGDLPATIIDVDEFRISVSGIPDDRRSREKLDVTAYLNLFGVTAETCSAYKRMFNRGLAFDPVIGEEVGRAVGRFYLDLCEQARADGEIERFFTLEVPVYRQLQKAMSAGISINAAGLSQKRLEAEYDFFFCLKNYSAKHDMPLESPSRSSIEARLQATGFDLDGVSVEYVLEFVPHENDFGSDTIELQDFDAARRVLSSLTLASGRTRPLIDVFGSRTSRIHLRNPSLQNIAKKYRSIISPQDGATLCYVDFDQYEVGIMAALSGDAQLAALYSEGDMYELFAKTHLGLADNRKAAKQLFLSYAYGMSRRALIDAAFSLGADRARAKGAFRLFGQYEEWKKALCADFQREGRISTPFGNHVKRSGTGSLTGKERRSAVSQVVQGTASAIFKKALLEVGEIADANIVLPMHDALLFEHRDAGTPAKVVAAFERVMTDMLEGRVGGKASIGEFAPA